MPLERQRYPSSTSNVEKNVVKNAIGKVISINIKSGTGKQGEGSTTSQKDIYDQLRSMISNCT